MAAHLRWRFEDPADPDPTTRTYTFPINPNAMNSPFPTKSVSADATTTIEGQVLLWEGKSTPKEWTFSGAILDAAHYEALRSWVYDRQGRLFVFDHFGRRLTVVLRSFDPTPQRSVGKYWRHGYDIGALVISVSQPIVNEVPA